MTSALVLTFHAIQSAKPFSEPPQNPFIKRYIISTEHLEHAVGSISTKACCTVSELVQKPEGHWVVLTFDDGFISDFEIAFPIVLNRGLKVTIFATVDNIGRKGYSNKAQLKQMAENGMEVGSHGLTHRYLTMMPRSEAIREICDSKTMLEDEIGIEVMSFAAVGGHYRHWMCEVAREAGYRAFATMIPGVTNVGKDLVLLRRNHLQNHHDAAYISQLLNGHGGGLVLNRLRYYFLRFPKLILGLRNYDRVKELLMTTCLHNGRNHHRG